MYVLTKIIRSKLKLMHKDYLDIILLGVCFIQTFFLILELIFRSNFFFDFFVFLSKFQIATLITGCLYFQLLIHKAKFAVRYLKYYIAGILSFEIIVILMFLYQLIFSDKPTFCYNYIFLTLSIFGVFFSGAVIIYLIYNSINSRFQENSNSFNLLCDEFYHMNMHIKKQLKVINKNQKYYIIILIVCTIASLLDLISMFAGKNEKAKFKEYNSIIKINNSTEVHRCLASTILENSLSPSEEKLDYINLENKGNDYYSNLSFQNSNNTNITVIKNISYSSCSMIKEINDTLDIVFCLSLYVIKDLLISIIIISVLIIKPSNNESSQAFIELT